MARKKVHKCECLESLNDCEARLNLEVRKNHELTARALELLARVEKIDLLKKRLTLPLRPFIMLYNDTRLWLKLGWSELQAASTTVKLGFGATVGILFSAVVGLILPRVC